MTIETGGCIEMTIEMIIEMTIEMTIEEGGLHRDFVVGHLASLSSMWHFKLDIPVRVTDAESQSPRKWVIHSSGDR